MLGPEMLLKALGIDPAEIKAATLQVIGQLQSGIASIDARLEAISAEQAAMREDIKTIHAHLGITNHNTLLIEGTRHDN